MKEFYLSVRNDLLSFIYRTLLKPLFFKLEPESIHDKVVNAGEVLGNNIISKSLLDLIFGYSNKRLEQTILGINFKNPVGLAAGFDKNAQLPDILPSIGFGFAEVGSITGEPCPGNPKPRLWRLKKSRGLLVWYGLKNDGSKNISNKLRDKKFRIPIGINVAKTNSPKTLDTKNGINDYIKAIQNFKNIGDYFVINISCPNSYGGLPFTNVNRLDQLLSEVDKLSIKKPVFLKLSPDLSKKEVDRIIFVSSKHMINGFICSNLTKKRSTAKINEEIPSVNGGMSGKIVEKLSDELISYIYKKTKGKYVIIGLGGIFNAKDAYRKIKLGASLVQIITGMIYEGPQVISSINMGLVDLLNKDGFKNVSQAIGVDSKDLSSEGKTGIAKKK